MTLSNCSKCQYFDRDSQHSENIVCAIVPAYAQGWKKLHSLDEYTLDCLPIDACSEFEFNPSSKEQEITLTLTLTAWQNLARNSSLSTVISVLSSLTFTHTLSFTLEQWELIANSCFDFRVLEQLRQHGIKPAFINDWLSVDSSCIDAISFFPSESALKIRFHSGSIYRYSDFSLDNFYSFFNAPSKGSFFHQHIKDQYECVKV